MKPGPTTIAAREWPGPFGLRAPSGGSRSVPPWVVDLVPSPLVRAFARRAELAEAGAPASLEPGHWLRPAMDRVSGWSISPLTLLELGRLLEGRRPARIVEFGGGVSTLAFAAFAERSVGAGGPCSIVSIEHDIEWLAKTRAILEEGGLARHVEFVHAPLAPATAYGRPQVAYSPPPGFRATMANSPAVDFVLVDGPPGTIGRLGSLGIVEPHLAEGATILLDDAFRHGERSAWAAWGRGASGRLRRSRIVLTSRGLAAATWASKGPRPE